ncbi:membrane-bound lytic murein transglycosylase MltC [Pantoea sp. Mhis]|uniref:membrane-bound lytic murein transglycosylase MltC n=1 Tax=Pantoea sp. Mhis TaxID=2576759 RepID=UPI00135C9EA9|nr:membrane-bound lytic murein transglycosylase MltC [Pantoea sp. Mhis]MXP56695.1 membrane-bound lytic murein transglycosylase MltC [Pantoea sp. Mhis]
MYKKLITLLVISSFLFSCSEHQNSQYQINWIRDINGFNILMEQFAANIEKIWGTNEVLITGPKDYIKYSDNYHTRGHINFEKGQVTIESVDNTNTIVELRKAIITMLLINDNSFNIVFNSKTLEVPNKEPLLYGQIFDNTGQPIRGPCRAGNFADYLIKNQLKKRYDGIHVIWYISIPMISNHLYKRAFKYLPIIRKAAKEYSIDVSLILAIIQIESSFNPYAVSHSDALGLMQVVQHTAGIDVFRMKGRCGQPSRSYLFDPKNNIDIGTAYISLLQNIYLNKIENPLSRRYAVITAYNGGVNSVLQVFSNNKQNAFLIINAMSSKQVYQILTSNHPSLESRLYLYRVSCALHNYHF